MTTSFLLVYVDDYGSIRVRDKQAYNNLLKAGLAVDKTRYGYDTLCTTEDLQMLFEVLTSVKDKNGHHAVFTPFANIANPDFERIKNSGFIIVNRSSKRWNASAMLTMEHTNFGSKA